MSVAEWSTIGALLLGPVLAVQAQKWIERSKERRSRKLWIFQTLMATRAAKVSTEHVQALNMIDLAFYGRRFFWTHLKSKKERQIVEAWKEYLDHLAQIVPDAEMMNWSARGDELFVNLLYAISRDVNFDFDRVSLKRGIYSPRAHGDLESDQHVIRKALVKLLSGQTPLKMDVVSLPGQPVTSDQKSEAQKSLPHTSASAIEDKKILTPK
jgi:uncharacterized protein DUF6680